ncbi:uncharacterized protein LOC129586919 [Paramacrobiotus metropolitanus]|uniref:uncharacterized protein LOC129586919 n=1 Tax=Paramacrobiotus metropolitanus TaxID=2943436 RepID=UPI002445E6CE|nr:uncharacterized protein LOC129586919 [Paramacrobiotus metropolitanus]
MRESIFLFSCCCVLLSFCSNSVSAQNLPDTGNQPTPCVDSAGNVYSPGAVVPLHHPCRQCVCGAKGNILCESLNKITECRPPPDAPCRNISGHVCCERSFACDRLAICLVGGAVYRAGDSMKNGNEKCQDCRCGSNGKVICEAAAHCGRPAWIAELGGNDCTPVYSGKECCPSDYLCKCTIFNETLLSTGPRSVARCSACSCSKSTGVSSCQPVACKLPYKFSDKCRAIYRGDDCCPVDYDCPGSAVKSGAGMKYHQNLEAPIKQYASTSINAAQRYIDGGRDQYDILPYGLPLVSNTTGPLGRSDDMPPPTTEKVEIVPTATVTTTRDTTTVEMTTETSKRPVEKNMRLISIPIGGIEVVPKSGRNSSGVFVTVKGEVAEVNGTVKNPSPPQPETKTTQDPLLRVFQKVAEKITRTTPPVSDSPDILRYDVSALITDTTRSSPEVMNKIWTTVASTPTPEVSLSTSTVTTTPPPSHRTDAATTEIAEKNDKGSGHSTVEDVESSTTGMTTLPAVSSSSESTTSTVNTSTKNLESDTIAAISITTGHADGKTVSNLSAENTTADVLSGSSFWKSPTNFNRGALGLTGNLTRHHTDAAYSMSSADAGFLADDLSYKLFSVNFFRVPLGETSAAARSAKSLLLSDAEMAANATLNSTETTSSDFIAPQGQPAAGLPLINATAANVTSSSNDTASSTELDLLAAADSSQLANVTLPPDFQVVTFGSMPRPNRPKSAGQLLPPMMPGLGGPGGPLLPFMTEVEFKGFGMMPEIELKPLGGGDLAGLAGMAAMLGGGGGPPGPSIGGQLAGAPPQPQPQLGNPVNRLAAAVAAQDAMEELAEGGTGDGALALAAAMMQSPNRPMAAKLVENTKMGFITTPVPTVAIVFPNGSMDTATAKSPIGRMVAAESGSPSQTGQPLAHYNSMFGSQNHHFQYPTMSNPWSNPIFTGAASNPQPTTTTDKPAPTKDPFPFEAVVDVLEEGRGPALTQLLGALHYMGRPSPMMPPAYGMMPQARSFGGMHMGGMQRSSYFPNYQSNGFGLEGLGALGMLPFSLFGGALSEPTPKTGRVPVAKSSQAAQPEGTPAQPQRRLNPGMNAGSENTSPLRPMYKVGSTMTESPLEGAVQPMSSGVMGQPAPLIAAMQLGLFER